MAKQALAKVERVSKEEAEQPDQLNDLCAEWAKRLDKKGSFNLQVVSLMPEGDHSLAEIQSFAVEFMRSVENHELDVTDRKTRIRLKLYISDKDNLKFEVCRNR